MRGKRSKQYRKLMEQFSMSFGFREPYQVLVDAEIVRDACRMKTELEPALQRTVHGKVKAMITQCEIRKLYAQKKEPGASEAIELAKTYERRRCGHHPTEYPEPLSTLECLESVVDPKQTGQNKHRYVVASQSQDVRRALRLVQGVPLIYIKRSVMILEPMADESVQVRAQQEKSKFRAELKNNLGKRKRAKDNDEEGSDDAAAPQANAAAEVEKKQAKKKQGPKGPNPLAVKKSKKKDEPKKTGEPAESETATTKPKRKRRRKAKPTGEDGGTGGGQADGASSPAAAGQEAD